MRTTLHCQNPFVYLKQVDLLLLTRPLLLLPPGQVLFLFLLTKPVEVLRAPRVPLFRLLSLFREAVPPVESRGGEDRLFLHPRMHLRLHLQLVEFLCPDDPALFLLRLADPAQ